MEAIKKEINTIMFVLVIIIGGLYSKALLYNAETSATILKKQKRIDQLNDNLSVLKNQSQINLVLRSHIKGRAEKELLNDEEYLELITK